MQTALAKTAIDDVVDEVRASGHFGLIVDESTDHYTEKTVIVYVKYECGGISKTKFLCVEELEAGDADGIVNCIKNPLLAYSLDIAKCVAFTGDGASVMTG